MRSALADALVRIEGRYGSRALTRGAASERRDGERRFATGTSIDALLGGGIASGEPVAFIGEGTCGKLELAARAVTAAQREGGTVAWIDPSATFDPYAAVRAGADLGRVMVVRPRAREDVLVAAGAALRGDGFRLVVVDTGPGWAARFAVDELASVLPLVRGSSAALLVVADHRGTRLALPALRFSHIAWEQRFGRTTGWSFAVARSHRDERALFALRADRAELIDLGVRRVATEGPADADLAHAGLAS